MEIFSFSFLEHTCTCFAWTFTSIRLTLYMLCFSCTEIPLQYLPYLYTDITIPFPFFANIFAHLHICPKHKLFLSISSCSHYASPNSACFENCSTSLTTHRSLGCSLRLSFTLSLLLSQSASSFQSLSSLSLSSVCIFTMCTRIWLGIWPVWIHVAGN